MADEVARLAPRSELLSPGWYIIGGGLLMIGAALAGIGWSQRSSNIEEMQRQTMPGYADVMLPEGFTTLYVEGTEEPVECTLQRGTTLVPVRPTARPIQYDAAGYRGHGALDFDTTDPGEYRLSCHTPQPATKFTVAIGRGAGAAMALVYAALLPVLAGLFALVLVGYKRRGAPPSGD